MVTEFDDAWNDVTTFISKFAVEVVFCIIGSIVAKIIRKVIVNVLNTIDLDQYGIGAPLERAVTPAAD